MRNADKDAGMTLIEVLIASIIIGVITMALVLMALSGYSLLESSRETNLALFDLQAVVERIMTTPFMDITNVFPAGEPIEAYNSLHLPEERIVVTYEDPEADPLIITATITWTGGRGRPRREQVYFIVRTK